MEAIGKLISGLSRGIALWIGDHAAQWLSLSTDDASTVTAGVTIIVTGVIWAAIHAVEDKIKAKKSE